MLFQCYSVLHNHVVLSQIQLTHLNQNLVNSGNTNLLYMVLNPKLLDLEVEVCIRN